MQNFQEFVCHSENLGNIFTLCDCPYKFCEIRSELKVNFKRIKS